MNFTEIVAEVLRITKRPDKLADIRREVNAAISFFASDTDFDRDLSEVLPPIDATLYAQGIPLSTFTRLRKFKYIRRAGTVEYLSRLANSEIFDKRCSVADRYYTAGSELKISMVKLASNLDIAFYQFPAILTDAAPDHWQLEGNWSAVIDRATAKVFSNIGDEASAKRHESYATAAYMVFRKDQLSLQG